MSRKFTPKVIAISIAWAAKMKCVIPPTPTMKIFVDSNLPHCEFQLSDGVGKICLCKRYFFVYFAR